MSKDFSSYELIHSMDTSLMKIFDDFVVFKSNGQIYMFDYETLEVVKLWDKSYSGVCSFILAENGEDYYVSFDSDSYVLYFDVSERTMTLYSYGVDLQ